VQVTQFGLKKAIVYKFPAQVVAGKSVRDSPHWSYFEGDNLHKDAFQGDISAIRWRMRAAQ
jgi:hypothetical protein